MLSLRFDLRHPHDDAAARSERYRAVPEMCRVAEQGGAVAVVLSEHHVAEGGYLSSPLTLAGAIASSTESLLITVAALVTPLHHPVALAEQMIAVDLLSSGRSMFVLALGYRPEEFELFGVDRSQRVERFEAAVAELRRAFSGGVSPEPFTPGGPLLLAGGGALRSAERAARLGLGFMPEHSDPALGERYLSACAELGIEPGPLLGPTAGAPTSVVVVDDIERGWRDVGPHLVYDARQYQGWLDADAHGAVGHGAVAGTVDELREDPGTYRIVDVDGAREIVEEHGILTVSPLVGGMPVELGRRCVELAVAATS